MDRLQDFEFYDSHYSKRELINKLREEIIRSESLKRSNSAFKAVITRYKMDSKIKKIKN